MMRTVLSCAVAAVATVGWLSPGSAQAATANVPDGVVGLWLFPNGADGNPEDAVIGNDVAFVHGGPGAFGGVSTQIGTESEPFLWQDDNLVQIAGYGAVAVDHGIGPNGGGSLTNEYTFLIDWKQNTDDAYSSIFDTFDGDIKDSANLDGELFHKSDGTIGSGDLGYSTLTYDPLVGRRIVVSADVGSFVKVYVDGELFLDSTTATAQTVDGRYALAPTFHLVADNAFEVAWGLLQTAVMWDHALSDAEVAAMGSFSDPNNGGFPTPLIFADPVPEPSTLILIGLGLSSLVNIRRRK